MSQPASSLQHLMWATRGRSWGFRFLLTAGLEHPLEEYDRAFAGLLDGATAWRRDGSIVAVRFLDPAGRRDSAGRTIPHEFVLFQDVGESVQSVEDGVHKIWPLVQDAYDLVWDADAAPKPEDLHFDA